MGVVTLYGLLTQHAMSDETLTPVRNQHGSESLEMGNGVTPANEGLEMNILCIDDSPKIMEMEMQNQAQA